MKNTVNKKWFTLVELIIVITILAILATIAFISFQGYSAEARDSKVKSEIGNMRNVIEVEMSKGVSVLNYASNTGSNLTALNLAWTWVDVNDSDIYKAWDVNKTLLNTNTTNTYKIWASTLVGWVYELAWKLSADGEIAYVIGNYSDRSTSAWTVWSFKVWDYVVVASVTGQVTAVSAGKDLVTVWGTSTWVANATLAVAETAWLIKDSDSTNPVEDGSTTALPF